MHHASDARAAVDARLAFSFIDSPKSFRSSDVTAGFVFQIDPQRRSTFNRFCQNRANRLVQSDGALFGEFSCDGKRTDARQKQRLSGVDISQSQYLRLVQQELLE